MKIKVMADYDCPPLWWDKGSPEVGPLDPRTLGLPANLVAALEAWAAAYDATLDRDDPAASGFPSAAAEQAFHEQGRRLAEQVGAVTGGQVRYGLD